ncbi:MAG TPA: hypothetical protein VKB38_06220 [Terracidiphilus sp.]|nr:hypothetical protein [Terracidiphilus sp.]
MLGSVNVLLHPFTGIPGRAGLHDCDSRNLAAFGPRLVNRRWIPGDIVLELLNDEGMHDLRRLVGNGCGEALVELQSVAGKTMLFVRKRRHQLASRVEKKVGRGAGRRRGGLQVGIGVLPRTTDLGLGAMAIVALEFDRAERAADGITAMLAMAEGNCAESGYALAQRGKFRMIAVEAADVVHKPRTSPGGLEVRVALHALPVANVVQPRQALVLHMAGRAGRAEELVGLVGRRLMTAQAGIISNRFPETHREAASRLAGVANAALIGKESVCRRQRSFAVERLPLRDSQP